MKTKHIKTGWLSVGVMAAVFSAGVCGMVGVGALGLEPPPATVAAPPELPPALSDPAFAQFVDPMFLGAAWQKMDAAMLTDGALMLAEGERVLMRPNKAVSAKFLMEVAGNLAALQRDSESLERLAQAAASLKYDALASHLRQTMKLADVSRDSGPKIAVDAEGATSDQFDTCKAIMRDIQAATLVGDVKALEQMKSEIAKLEVPAATRDALMKMCHSSGDATEQAKADPRIDALNKLSDVSRQWPVFPGGPGAWPGPIVVPGAPGNVSIWNPERVYNPWTNVPIPGTVQGVNRWDPMTGQWVSGTTWVDPYGRPRGNLEYTNPWTGQRTGIAYSRKGVDSSGNTSQYGNYVPGSGSYGRQ